MCICVCVCVCVTQEDANKSTAEPVAETENLDAATDSEDELPLKPKKVFNF